MFNPDGLFHRLMTRSIRWSQECGGHEPELFYRKSRLFLDNEHDFCLEMSASWLSRVRVGCIGLFIFNFQMFYSDCFTFCLLS